MGAELPHARQSLTAIGHGFGEIKSKPMKAVKVWLIAFDGDPTDKKWQSADHLRQQ